MSNNKTKKGSQYSALDIAKFFIWKSQQENRRISNKKLQKLLYYSQAWSLVLDNKPLFDDKIEAWVHGPAIKSVYREFKRFGFNPIEIKVDEEDIEVLKNSEVLNSVWNVYGNYDANYLEYLTHSEDPWQNARESLEFDRNSDIEISLEAMKSYYSSLLEKSKDE